MILTYFTNLGFLDFIILTLGSGVAGFALYGTRQLSTNHTLNKRGAEEGRKRWLAIQRVMTVITDIFPLLGLLGTALAILNTFLSLSGPIDPSSVVANFAPGLTTTISGIFCAIVNTLLLQIYFNPALEKRFDS